MGIQFARAQAQGANLRGADLSDANCYASAFDGADLEVRRMCQWDAGCHRFACLCSATRVLLATRRRTRCCVGRPGAPSHAAGWALLCAAPLPPIATQAERPV